MKVLYACGPGNTFESTRYWLETQSFPDEIAQSYSGLFLDVIREKKCSAYLISKHHKTLTSNHEFFTIEHRPNQYSFKNGITYHLGQIIYGLKLVKTALLGKFDLLIVANETTHWFILILLKPMKLKVVASHHSTIYSDKVNNSKSIKHKISKYINRFTLRHAFYAHLVISKKIKKEIFDLTLSKHPPILEFIPHYDIKNINSTHKTNERFNLIYVGRVERYKGVFLLLDIAEFIKNENLDIEINIYGDGPDLERLIKNINEKDLSMILKTHGHLDNQNLKLALSEASAMIIPTLTDFSEGFAKTVSEAVISGLPIISSSVVPGIQYVKDAVYEAIPDKPESYISAVKTLYENKIIYKNLQNATSKYRHQFSDKSKSYYNVVKEVIESIRENRNVNSISIEIID